MAPPHILRATRAFRLLSFVATVTLTMACGPVSEPTAADPSGGLAGGGSDGAGGGGGSECVPAPAVSESVTIDNAFGTLTGTLEIPEACHPVAVVLIVGGTGSTDRDGNAPFSQNRTNSYLELGSALRERAHVATLRYDDHGVGESYDAAPPLSDFTFELEVEDAARWVAQLRRDERLSSVFIAGHSQGSLTGIVSARQERIDGLISLAGTGRRGGQLLIAQLAPKLTPEQLQQLRDAVAKMEAGQVAGPLPSPLNKSMPEELQPYLISWFKYDPKQEIGQFDAPALIVQGTTDRQVSEVDAKLLHEGKPDAELVMVDDMAHTLKQATDSREDQIAAYTDPSVPLARDLLPALQSFIEQTASQ